VLGFGGIPVSRSAVLLLVSCAWPIFRAFVLILVGSSGLLEVGISSELEIVRAFWILGWFRLSGQPHYRDLHAM
jgi:hypothetical protein